MMTGLPSVFYLKKPKFSHSGHHRRSTTTAEQALPLILSPGLLGRLEPPALGDMCDAKAQGKMHLPESSGEPDT